MALRLGAESKPKLFAAIGLGVIVLIIAIIQIPKFFGGSTSTRVTAPPVPIATTPSAPASEPSASPKSGSSTAEAGAAAYPHEATQLPSASALDPTLHPELMAQAEDTTYSGNGRNIFSPNSVAPAAVNIEKPKNFRPQAPLPPPGPPPPPSIDLKFYGYSSNGGGNRQIFLLHGDDIFLAHQGDVVDRRYRVVAIGPFSVQIEDIPYHNTQSLPLSQN
jgi:hypothetical protein